MKRMNIQCRAAALVILGALSLTACTEKVIPPIQSKSTSSETAQNDPRAKVLGVESAGPAQETPSTTSSAKSDVSKAEQATAMPLPGQANDHSTLSPKPTQKSGATGR